MNLGDIHHFEDMQHYHGWVRFDEESIQKLEDEVKQIKKAIAIIVKQDR